MDQKLQEVIQQSKELKAKLKKPFTHKDHMKIKGYERLSEEEAKEALDQMQQYIKIVMSQMNRLGLLDEERSMKKSE